MTNVFIADDQPHIRQAIKELLSANPEITVVGEASNGQQVLDQLDGKDWDVVVLDISMPKRDGLSTLAELKRKRPNLPVLMLSMHSEQQFGQKAIRAGADGFLTKYKAPEHLAEAIIKLTHGQKFFSPEMAKMLYGKQRFENQD